MPRLYLSTTEVTESALGQSPQIQAILAQMPPGALDKLISRASRRVDATAKRRIQAPGSTTLAQPANVGDTQISVSSTLTLDERDEQAVQFGGETLVITGVEVTDWSVPLYPGTLILAQPLANNHAQGEMVNYLYQEIREASHASSGDPFTEAFTQEAQLAQAHAPIMAKGLDLTRLAWTRQYPIITFYSLNYTYSYDTLYYPFSNLQALAVNNNAGSIRFRVGTVILPEGFIKIAYTGGFTTIPDDLKSATELYLMDELKHFMNPFGVQSQTLGKRSMNYGPGNAQEADKICLNYKRRGI